MTSETEQVDEYVFHWRWKPLELVRGKIILFGYPLFEGWLPWASFYTYKVVDDRTNQHVGNYKTFEVFWLTYGYVKPYHIKEF